MDDPGRQQESVLTVRRVGAIGLDPGLADGTSVARDLDVEDPRLGERKVRDGPVADLERLAEAGAAIGAVLEGEDQRRGIGDRSRAGAAGMAGLAAGGLGVRIALGAPIEDCYVASARGGCRRRWVLTYTGLLFARGLGPLPPTAICARSARRQLRRGAPGRRPALAGCATVTETSRFLSCSSDALEREGNRVFPVSGLRRRCVAGRARRPRRHASLPCASRSGDPLARRSCLALAGGGPNSPRSGPIEGCGCSQA